MRKRVVVTGLGVIAPNGHGIEAFETALKNGESGIRFIPELEELKFGCQVAGVPQGVDDICSRYFTGEQLLAMNSSIKYASISAIDAWKDAGFEVPEDDSEQVDWDTGAIIGTGIGGMDTIGEKIVPLTNAGKTRRLGSTAVEQVMASGVSAKVSGLLGLGNQVTSNSCACSTGTEAILDAMYRIRHGLAERMLAGGAEGASPYIWSGFDAMRVLNRTRNDEPVKASRPMSASAAGFIPGAGAGILMIESLDSALERGARIYAEIMGGAINCGGHRMGGSMTAPNPVGVQRCVQNALTDAGIEGSQVDAINGHLTATFADPYEINNWAKALGRTEQDFPLINATKSLIGHSLGAAGGLESIACVLQVYKGFVHGSVNCEDLHAELLPYSNSIVQKTRETPELKIQAKASFGFGDVNACVLYKKWQA
ncbi:MAG: beta-ketoacyl-[acyl-carrier-protein] synthase family protein [Caldithrix sp.]|nr:MAG: beta-ketoacyl-[acyl-carrier-protein] synthase family protein [Caldithrix sp.]TDI96650.1 MAG: beta-ketoacyl-[acyl-carrier-protein] synthase family protein [Caldithrix sp.]